MGLSVKDLHVLKENVRLHKSEAYFYEVQHPEIYNIKEQTRVKQLLTLYLSDMAANVLCIDVGSGTGNICAHLSSLKKEVVACDLSKDMLKQNKNATHRIVCDAGNLPIKDHISNLASTYSFFHHVPDALKVVREICRITKEKEAKLYFDHDNFMTNASFSDKSKFDDPHVLFDYLCWLVTKPNMIKKFWEYILYGRYQHKAYIKRINFTLTDHNVFNPKQIVELLTMNDFHVHLIKYSTGSCIMAEKTDSVNFFRKTIRAF